jgi:ABC-type nickel/cobalt efflux system permease component RcnA
MTDARHTRTDFLSSRPGRVVRDVLAAVIALAFLGLVIFLAAMLTAAFLVLAGIALLTGGAYWLWRKLRGRKAGDADDILVATRGPDGWTVDGLGR